MSSLITILAERVLARRRVRRVRARERLRLVRALRAGERLCLVRAGAVRYYVGEILRR